MEENKGKNKETNKDKNNEKKQKTDQEQLWKAIRGEKLERTAEEWEEQQRNRVHTLQTVLWVCLILFQMMVLQSITVRTEVNSEVWAETRTADKAEIQAEATTEVPAAVSGASFPATPSDAGGRLIQREVVYRQVEGAAELPETLKVTVKENGNSETVVCQIASAVPERERWVDDFSFPVTFYDYGAQYYQVGELLVSEEGDRPPLDACRDELLRMLGLSSDAYEITEAVWAGEAYPAEDGILCRDALVRGRKLVRDYRVRYAGSLTIPESSGFSESRAPSRASVERAGQDQGVAEDSQTREDGAGERSEGGEGEGAEVHLEPESPGPDRDPMAFWKTVTRTLLIIIGIGVLLFFGGLVILAILRLAKSVRKWYTVHENKKSWKR